tara:strand:+ start:9399 stop:9665 length:267 start_codon:yes stop_codon:yes gene_type:complete
MIKSANGFSGPHWLADLCHQGQWTGENRVVFLTVIDDHHPAIAAKWPGITDRTIGGGEHHLTGAGMIDQPIGPTAAINMTAKALCNLA